MKKYPKDELYSYMLMLLLIDALEEENIEETDRLYKEICSMKGAEKIREKSENYLFPRLGYDPVKKQFYKK